VKVVFQGFLVLYIITLPLNVDAQFWIGEFYDLSRGEVIRNHSEEQSIHFKVVSDIYFFNLFIKFNTSYINHINMILGKNIYSFIYKI